MIGPAVPLFGYQRKWFLDRSRFKIGKFARQTGKTFTTTLEVVDDCFEHAVEGRRARWVMGEKVVEDAQRRYGSRVEGVLFTGSSKLIMATAGKQRFEDRTVRIWIRRIGGMKMTTGKRSSAASSSRRWRRC
jgi:phage FluMu gp28-like protein